MRTATPPREVGKDELLRARREDHWGSRWPQTTSPGWECGRVTEGAGEGPGWDFFVSYTQADRAWAEWIAWLLEEDGYRVLVQAWDMVAGSHWISRIGVFPILLTPI